MQPDKSQSSREGSSSSRDQYRKSKSPPRCGSSVKDRKGNALSCAECRRSKLKCDRTVPCQACVRRGCAALCPNGTMNATKGNKVLQSRAQKLGEQVTSMEAKIKELESALANAHLQYGIDSEAEEEGDSRDPQCVRGRRRPYGEGSGSLAIDSDGVSRFHGDTAQSEYLSGLIPGDGLVGMHRPDIEGLGLPAEMKELFNAFPFGMRDHLYTKALFLPFIPSYDRALELVEGHYQNFSWIYNGVTKTDFTKEILDRIYCVPDSPSVDHIHPHRLSVFFSVMAIGVSRSFEPNAVQQAEMYYVLACSALSLCPLISEAMVATVQAVFLVNAFLCTSTRVSTEESWLLIGLCGRLAFRIGLHRDGTQFKLDEAETQRRRVLFWELYSCDAWFSFVTGRAPSIHLPDTDTKFPEDVHDSGIAGFHSWKFRYTAACLWPIVRLASAKVASYQATMSLDKKIRTFPIPINVQPPLQGFASRAWSNDPASAMQQYYLVCERELNLLFLHRNYLAVALRADPYNPISHKFGGSVMAAYRSVRRMCTAMAGLYQLHPKPVSGVWFFWSGIFSSCIVLSAILIACPMCSLAPTALTELRAACDLFIRGSEPCRHPKSLTLLQNLLRRSEAQYASYMKDPERFAEMKKTYVPSPMDELLILGAITQGVIPHPSPQSLHVPVPVFDVMQGDESQQMDQALSQDTTSYDTSATVASPGHFPDPFDLNDFEFGDASNLPTYEQIMSIAGSTVALVPSEPYSMSAIPQAGSSSASQAMPGHYEGQEVTATLAGEGGHESIWRSFIGGLMGGQDPGPLSKDYFF